MRRRTYLPLLLVAAPGLVAVGMITPASAAGSNNGVASKSAGQIAAAATTATESATSFTYGGSVKQNGVPSALKASLNSAGNGQGTLTLSAQPVKVIKLGNTIYLSSTKAFWTKYANATAAKTIGTSWVSISSTDSDFNGIAALFDSKQVVDGFLSATNNTFTKGKTSTVNGQQVIAITSKDKSDNSSGTIYIATSGQPYIVKVASPGSNGGSLSFTGYGKPVNPTAPPNPIAIPSSSTPTTG